MKIGVLLGILAGSIAVQASPITFSGSVTGVLPNGQSMYKGSGFTGSSFSGTADSHGNLTIDLGTYSEGRMFWTANDGLKLTISFDNPLNSAAPVTATFAADVYNGGFNGWWWNEADLWFDQTTATPLTFKSSSGTVTASIAIKGTLSTGASEVGECGIPHIWVPDGTIQATISNAQFTPAVAPVPEPASLGLIGLGLAGLGVAGRNRLRRK